MIAAANHRVEAHYVDVANINDNDAILPQESYPSVVSLAVSLGLMLLFFNMGWLSNPDGVSLAVTISLIVGVVTFSALINYRDKSEIAEWKKKELARLKRAAFDEAVEVSNELMKLRTVAGRLATECRTSIVRAENELNLARIDFNERAFGPFWTHIGNSAEFLAGLLADLQELASLEHRYREKLAGRIHDFPESVLDGQTVPSPAEIVLDLKKIAREGQKDFEFAMIWEHHKTRKVMEKGFETLEVAIEHLQSATETTLSQCTAAIVGASITSSRSLVSAIEMTSQELKESSTQDTERILERLPDRSRS